MGMVSRVIKNPEKRRIGMPVAGPRKTATLNENKIKVNLVHNFTDVVCRKNLKIMNT